MCILKASVAAIIPKFPLLVCSFLPHAEVQIVIREMVKSTRQNCWNDLPNSWLLLYGIMSEWDVMRVLMAHNDSSEMSECRWDGLVIKDCWCNTCFNVEVRNGWMIFDEGCMDRVSMDGTDIYCRCDISYERGRFWVGHWELISLVKSVRQLLMWGSFFFPLGACTLKPCGLAVLMEECDGNLERKMYY